MKIIDTEKTVVVEMEYECYHITYLKIKHCLKKDIQVYFKIHGEFIGFNKGEIWRTTDGISVSPTKNKRICKALEKFKSKEEKILSKQRKKEKEEVAVKEYKKDVETAKRLIGKILEAATSYEVPKEKMPYRSIAKRKTAD